MVTPSLTLSISLFFSASLSHSLSLPLFLTLSLPLFLAHSFYFSFSVLPSLSLFLFQINNHIQLARFVGTTRLIHNTLISAVVYLIYCWKWVLFLFKILTMWTNYNSFFFHKMVNENERHRIME